MADNSSVRMAPSADLETDYRFLTVLSCAHGFCSAEANWLWPSIVAVIVGLLTARKWTA